jgi:hypothetical protein
MESLSEFLSRTQPPEINGPSRDKPDFMNLKRSGRDDRSAPAVHSSQAQDAEHKQAVDHLVRGLIELLPKTDSIWRLDDRVKWLRLAADIFEVGYKTGDSAPGEISIVAVNQVAAKSKG